MRVHLRFTEKDIDLCRWRHSVKWSMFSHYIEQIMIAEIKHKIAFIPNAGSVSVNSNPCDITWRTDNSDIEEYLSHVPSYKRNAHIKKIIRKHLQAQGTLVDNFSVPQEIRPARPKEQTKVEKKMPKPDPPPKESVPLRREEPIQSDKDREAIMALIAMGGE